MAGLLVRCRILHGEKTRDASRGGPSLAKRLGVPRTSRAVAATAAHSTRSTVVKGSRGRRERFAIANWWRSARISTCRAARERTNNRSEWRNETTTDRWIEPIRAAHNLNCHKVSRVLVGTATFLLCPCTRFSLESMSSTNQSKYHGNPVNLKLTETTAGRISRLLTQSSVLRRRRPP